MQSLYRPVLAHGLKIHAGGEGRGGGNRAIYQTLGCSAQGSPNRPSRGSHPVHERANLERHEHPDGSITNDQTGEGEGRTGERQDPEKDEIQDGDELYPVPQSMQVDTGKLFAKTP